MSWDSLLRTQGAEATQGSRSLLQQGTLGSEDRWTSSWVEHMLLLVRLAQPPSTYLAHMTACKGKQLMVGGFPHSCRWLQCTSKHARQLSVSRSQ